MIFVLDFRLGSVCCDVVFNGFVSSDVFFEVLVESFLGFSSLLQCVQRLWEAITLIGILFYHVVLSPWARPGFPMLRMYTSLPTKILIS